MRPPSAVVRFWPCVRKKIAANLPVSVLQEEWKKVDDFIGKMRSGLITVYPPPFDFGGPKEKVLKSLKEGHELDRAEQEHRNEMLKRG
jgi:hypothetical protein